MGFDEGYLFGTIKGIILGALVTLTIMKGYGII